MRARGGVASSAWTRTSRQEQAASSTTPGTTAAGRAGNSTLEIAPRANSMASSVRFTTAAPVASRFLNVVVSRNGLMTISSSPHSTPMGAKFTAPRASTVVRMDSMITAPAPGRPSARRRRGRGACRGGGGPVQEPVQQHVAVLREHGLGVELQADHRMAHVLDGHDLPVIRGRGDAEVGGQTRAGDDERVVARRQEGGWESGERATDVGLDA